MKKTRVVIYRVTAADEKETADKQFGVFDLNTLNPQVLFSINVLLAIGVSQHKKKARLLAAVQEMSPHPSSCLGQDESVLERGFVIEWLNSV